MPLQLSLADALRAAINVLRDSAESGKMPSGAPLDSGSVEVHETAAEILKASLAELHDFE